MELYSGKYFGADIKIEYKDSTIEISRFLDDKTFKFNYTEYEAVNYHTLILKRLCNCMVETLKEMNNSLEININCVTISQDGVYGLLDVYPSYAIDVISEILNKYREYIIKPSLLVDCGITHGMYREAHIKKYDGILLGNRKYIIESIYLVPYSNKSIVKLFFSDSMSAFDNNEIEEMHDKALKEGDDREINKCEANLFSMGKL